MTKDEIAVAAWFRKHVADVRAMVEAEKALFPRLKRTSEEAAQLAIATANDSMETLP